MRHILCFGNPLHGDDGFGHAVYQQLVTLPLPNDLRLFDAGTPGPAALMLFQGCDEVIIVDACNLGNEPGRLSQPLPEAIIAEASVSGHGAGVGYLLQALAALPEQAPRIRIIAVEIATAKPFQPGLSAAVTRGVDEAVSLLRTYFPVHQQ
ncbi:MAG: hydrogenase maturation protease [Methylomonas sp.]|jgi:hydrogenase maturation protease